MQDLSSTMFYKAKFTIISQNETEDLLWRLVCEVRDWLTSKHNKDGEIVVAPNIRKWTRFKTGGKLFDEKSSSLFFAKSVYHSAKDNPNAISWACKIEEKPEAQNGYAPREWITEIGYQSTKPGTAEVSYVVSYSDMAGFLGELAPAPELSLPRVVKSFLYNREYICKIGSTELRAHPFRLKSGDYPDFENLLFDKERVVPIVYISPKHDTEDSEKWTTLVSPKELARSVAANAVVYYSEDSDFWNEMQYMGDSRYTCSGGAIRVYQPSIDKNNPNDKYRHRIIFADYIEERGERAVLEMFRRALAQDVHFYETMFRIDSCQALIDRDEHQARIERITAKKEGEVDEAYTEYLVESEKRCQVENELEQSKDIIKRQKGEIYRLELQVSANQEKADRLDEVLRANEQIRAMSQYPSKPEQIARYFETVFVDRIAFTEKAYKSLKECITKSDVLWDALYCMATDLYDYCHSHPAQAYKMFTDKTGWACGRGVGTTTHSNSKMMRQYVDQYAGHDIDIEPHVKTGKDDKDPKSVRIYFAYDPEVTDKIIIGYCGKHLDNATTRKVK